MTRPALPPLLRLLASTRRKVEERGLGYLPRRAAYPVKRAALGPLFPTAHMRRRARLALTRSDPDRLRAELAAAAGRRWHFAPGDLRGIADATETATLIDVADDLVEHRFTFRGAPAIQLDELVWEPPDAARHVVWDLNRHTWFTTLGLAYTCTADPRYAQAFVAASASWVTANAGRLTSLAWDGPFEVAARINAWVWAHSLFSTCPEWPTSHYVAYVDALGLMAEYLYQTMEFHDAGNHLLLEAKALALCATAFPEYHGAARWGAKAWATLDRELGRQICADGVHAERSSMYHRIVAGELGELWCLALRNGLPAGERLGHVVRRMAAFDATIAEGDRRMPLWGDASSDDTYFRFYAPSVVDAVDRGVGPRRSPASDLTPWLVHRWTGSRHDGARPPVVDAVSRGFPEGGYYVSRSGCPSSPTVLVWDCGPVGFRGNTKHAHVDVLSCTFAVAGTSLLIDPGTSGDDARREVLRSTRSHNTVVVDGQDQAVLAPRSEVLRTPTVRRRLWATSTDLDVMVGMHDGYARLPEPAWHTRTVVVVHGAYVLILDDVHGTGHHVIEGRFHIAPRVDVRRRNGGAGVTLTSEGSAASLETIDVSSGRGPVVSLEPAAVEMITSVPEAMSVLVTTLSGLLPLSLATLVVPHGEAVHCEVLEQDDGWICLDVASRAFSHVVAVSKDPGRSRTAFEDWSTDAAVAVFRRDGSRRVADVLTAGATRVRRGQHALTPEPPSGGHDRGFDVADSATVLRWRSAGHG